MISVCMGIYNGEAYIEEQLLSILHQTLPPDQVVLCDDGSTDRTREIINDFIQKHQLEKGWRLYCNKENKGYPGNFYYSMSLCSEKYVFLADQDDIWDIRKLERMTAIMEAGPKACAVCCKFGLIDAEGKDIHTMMAPARSRDTQTVKNISIEGVFYKCEWPGMVIAYRRKWYQDKFERWRKKRQLLLPEVRYPDIPHDFLICAWAAEEEGFFQLDDELAWHRRHDHNTGGEEHHLRRLLNRERKLKEIADYNGILDAFLKQEVMETAKGREALSSKYRTMRERYEALLSGSLLKVAGNAWKNRRSVRAATAICDLLIACQR